MTLKLATKETKQARDPQRAALAEAVEAAGDAEAALAEQQEAVERGREVVSNAQRSMDAANAAVGAARERDAQHAAKAIRTGAAAAPGAARSARAAAQDAEDALDVARAALAQLESDLTELKAGADRARVAVEVCVNEVLAAEADHLIAELEKAKAELLSRQAALHFIRCRRSIQHGAYRTVVPELAAPLEAVEPRIQSAISTGVVFSPETLERLDVTQRWEAACQALAVNADARLPD
jgi:chromosome segregation ATPase